MTIIDQINFIKSMCVNCSINSNTVQLDVEIKVIIQKEHTRFHLQYLQYIEG